MEKTGKCVITGKEYPLKDLVGIDSIRPQIRELIKKAYPEWSADRGMISIVYLLTRCKDYLKFRRYRLT